ncbi:DUF92 domain-containing protein [Balneolales bacterium ANBcel1]|nr:DUF92 domain-containing protein [Balneolales bacterium ANBcel1]
MADRLLNYLSGFVLIVIFVLFSDPTQRIWIIAALVLSLAAVAFTLLNNSLSIDGAAAALAAGTLAMGLGHATGAVLLLFFFFSSYLLARWLDKKGDNRAQKVSERRKGVQVWANLFWFLLLLVLWALLGSNWMLVAAAASISAAASDTWASASGERLSAHARLITTFRKVRSGTDGAVSVPGTLAGLAAAFIMALLFMLAGWTLDFRAAAVIMISAFSGCIADSYLGAIFQVHKVMHRLILFTRNYPVIKPLKRLVPDNNGVNFLATGIAALIAYMLY